MATTTARGIRIDQFLGALQSWVEDFPALVGDWESLEEADQVGTSLQWDHLMADYLTELDEHYRDGEMSIEQAEGYRRLLGQLKEILPLIQKLQFWEPIVSLDS